MKKPAAPKRNAGRGGVPAIRPGRAQDPRDSSWEHELGPFLMAIYRARPDVVATFPDVQLRDRDAFLAWARTHGPRELGYDAALAQPGQSLLPGPVMDAVLTRARAALHPSVPDAAPLPAYPVAGVNVVGYLRDESGLGAAARGYVGLLDRMRVPVALKDVSDVTPNRSEDDTLRPSDDAFPHDLNLVCVTADQHHNVKSRLEPGFFDGRYNVAVWYWELGRFPEEWHDRFAEYDEVWAGSSFGVNALAPISPVPVVRVPPLIGVGPGGSRARGRRALQATRDELVFLYVFDFHSSFERKNPLAAIDAFRSAFAPSEPARLVIKCVNEAASPSDFEAMVARAEGRRVAIHTGYWHPREMRDLTAACDAYVSLHRSEGLGLTIAEAMLLGKPAIATAWSANTDFMDVSNSFPVRYELVALPRDFGPYRAGEVWADPSVEHAAAMMRFVFEHRGAAAAIAERGRRDARAYFSGKSLARLVADRLSAIAQRRARRLLSRPALAPDPVGDGAPGGGGDQVAVLERRVTALGETVARAAGRIAAAERGQDQLRADLDELAERLDDQEPDVAPAAARRRMGPGAPGPAAISPAREMQQ